MDGLEHVSKAAILSFLIPSAESSSCQTIVSQIDPYLYARKVQEKISLYYFTKNVL